MGFAVGGVDWRGRVYEVVSVVGGVGGVGGGGVGMWGG